MTAIHESLFRSACSVPFAVLNRIFNISCQLTGNSLPHSTQVDKDKIINFLQMPKTFSVDLSLLSNSLSEFSESESHVVKYQRSDWLFKEFDFGERDEICQLKSRPFFSPCILFPIFRADSYCSVICLQGCGSELSFPF
jgi:hypothetical protein